MHIIAAGSVVERNEKFLLVQEGRKEFSGKWNLPCGELEAEESFPECAIREGKEETGYQFKIVGWLGQHHQRPNKSFGGHSLIVNVFYAKIVGGEKTVPSDLMNVAWFTWKQINDMALNGELVHPYVLNSIMAYRGYILISSSNGEHTKNMIPIPSDRFKVYNTGL